MRKKNTKIFSYIAASILMLGAACGGEDNKETLDPIAVTPDAAPTGEEKEKEPSATPDITSTGGEKEEDPSATPDANLYKAYHHRGYDYLFHAMEQWIGCRSKCL